jgi:excisionase family DNA binding protein
MTDTPLLVGIRDAAKRLGIGRSKLYELVKAREIVPVRIGSRALIPMSALNAFVDKVQNRGAVDNGTL